MNKKKDVDTLPMKQKKRCRYVTDETKKTNRYVTDETKKYRYDTDQTNKKLVDTISIIDNIEAFVQRQHVKHGGGAR